MVMCDSCPFNTGVVYCSIPVQYQCRLTGEFHRSGEECDADVVAVVRCKDCKWGKALSGNIECSVDLNLPPEYHGYEWFCPNGERREDETDDTPTEQGNITTERLDTPTIDSVPVVRCKDCKWTALCIMNFEYKGADGYCSRGERREDG